MTLRILNRMSRCVLAGIFLYSGYIKIQSPLQFAAALAGYKLFPEAWILPLATYFPWLELGLGVLLLVGWKMRYVAIATTGLLALFTVLLSITYLRGIDANCGCFSFEDKISPWSIARDSLFLLPAIFLVLETRLRGRGKAGAGDLTPE